MTKGQLEVEVVKDVEVEDLSNVMYKNQLYPRFTKKNQINKTYRRKSSILSSKFCI